MIRRALFITVGAVALIAAGALAVVPAFARSPRRWSIGHWSLSGFTPIPLSRDTSTVTHDPAATEAEGGIPGTFCPVKPRDSKTAVARDSAFDLAAGVSRPSSTETSGLA